MRRELSVSQLERLVCAAASGWQAAEECCEALRDSGLEVIGSTSVPKRQLKRIYQIRLSREKPEGPPVLGAERILSDIDAYEGEELTMVALPRDREVYCLLLDDTASHLVTCFVGRDRRDIPTG
jgi:hypothetical protein